MGSFNVCTAHTGMDRCNVCTAHTGIDRCNVCTAHTGIHRCNVCTAHTGIDRCNPGLCDWLNMQQARQLGILYCQAALPVSFF